MTPDLLARLRPWLSVYRNSNENGADVRQTAGMAVPDTRATAGNLREQGLVSPNMVMRLTAAAVIRGRAHAVRSAVVRIRAATENNGKFYQVLAWE